MLLPEQVAPFLAAGDPLVRRQARDYFRICGDPTPVTADDVWVAFDRYEQRDAAYRTLETLSWVSQTDASVRRLVAVLDADPPEPVERELRAAARAIDLPVLLRHRDVLLGCDGIDPAVRDYLGRRIAAADCSADVAWDRLMAAGVADGHKYLDEVDGDGADIAVEAAAGHIDALGPRAIALLADPAVDDWRETFVIRMVGQARYAPATAVLVGKLAIDADLLQEEVPLALGRIGTDEVIDRLVAFSPGKDWGWQLSPGEALSRIKRPAAETALLRLVEAERDDEIRGFLLNNVLDLCSMAGLDAARLLIVADPRHPESIGLCERLLGTAAMHGVTLPEEPRWRERIAAHEREVAERTARLDRGGLQAFVGRMAALGGGLDREEPVPAPRPKLPLPGEYDPYARLEPIRNDAPKVGRNDPCPCGSGKKHKKCCGAPR